MEIRALLSTLWLWCCKAWKWICRRMLGYPSELERLCRVVAVRSSAVVESDWWWMFVVAPWRLARRLVSSIKSIAATDGAAGDEETPQDGWKRAMTPESMFRLDRALLFSTALALPRRQLESWDGEDLHKVWRSMLRLKRFRRGPGDALATAASCRLFRILFRIRITFRLLHDLNARAATKYDPSNKMHERRILELWQVTHFITIVDIDDSKRRRCPIRRSRIALEINGN
jgi:hypothetical protein